MSNLTAKKKEKKIWVGDVGTAKGGGGHNQ
jgi:hypothetical protein